MPDYLRGLPELHDADGAPFQTVQHASDAWVQHFAAVEGGYAAAPDLIVITILEEQRRSQHHPMSGLLQEALSRHDVRESLRKVRAGSAPGPDGISASFQRSS